MFTHSIDGVMVDLMIARFLMLEKVRKIANCLVGRALCQDSLRRTPELGSVGIYGCQPGRHRPATGGDDGSRSADPTTVQCLLSLSASPCVPHVAARGVFVKLGPYS